MSREQLREGYAPSNRNFDPQRRERASRSSTVCVMAVHDARPGPLGTPGLVLFGLAFDRSEVCRSASVVLPR